MINTALAPYEQALRTAGPLGLRTTDGGYLALDVARWLAPPDQADESVLDRCAGPVLDIGCGPGRFVAALNCRGISALGVDIAYAAVALTQVQGMPALQRNVFADLPGEGRWPTALLMDGNIGIGGDPGRLLARIRSLLRAGGTAIVEADPEPGRHQLVQVRFCAADGPVGPAFDWACLGRDVLLEYARDAGYAVVSVWSASGRVFVELRAA